MYFTPVQRGVLKALASSKEPLTLREITMSLSKRPCARKLIPQIVKLKNDSIISCIYNNGNTMDIEYSIVPELTEKFKEQFV